MKRLFLFAILLAVLAVSGIASADVITGTLKKNYTTESFEIFNYGGTGYQYYTGVKLENAGTSKIQVIISGGTYGDINKQYVLDVGDSFVNYLHGVETITVKFPDDSKS